MRENYDTLDGGNADDEVKRSTERERNSKAREKHADVINNAKGRRPETRV